jgi:hypothetical protein
MTEANKGLMNAAQKKAATAAVLPNTVTNRLFSKRTTNSNLLGLFTESGAHGPKTLLENNYLEAVNNLKSGNGTGSQYVIHEVPNENVQASVNELIHNSINP